MIAESRGLRPRETAETLAIEALSWLAGDEEALSQFITLSGIGPDDLRSAAGDPGFLAALLDFVTSEDSRILAFAAHAGVKPERVVAARRILNGHD
jgi:hypothetical protein